MKNIEELIRNAYEEDLPAGDLTTDSIGIDRIPGTAQLVAKEDLILSGQEIFEQCLQYICGRPIIKWYFKNADLALKGQTLALIETNLIELLKAERVALNFLGRLSGIATLTRCFVKPTEGTNCKILDTRKTTPGLRDLEKKAVLDGGGSNHRRDLSSAILIKENHIRAGGGLEKTLRRILQSSPNQFIEVEVTNIDELKKALQFPITRVMLDNMSDQEMVECLKVIPSHIEVEASGNMSLERIKGVAQIGVGFISVGAITHSAPVADFSLLFNWEEPQ